MQQLTAQVVAEQMGIGVRHLRREQRDALETLAYRLWNQFNVGSGLQAEQRGKDRRADEPGGLDPVQAEDSSIRITPGFHVVGGGLRGAWRDELNRREVGRVSS